MLKAVFLDMDETLCDTSFADKYAKEQLSKQLEKNYSTLNADLFCERFVEGFYKRLNHELPELVSILLKSEKQFREALIKRLFQEQHIAITDEEAAFIHADFNRYRFDGFDFFAASKPMLKNLSKDFKLIVITNGPIFSQRPKIEKTKLASYVDHIIVGGEEPEEKPAKSIFEKALKLANCLPEEAVHVGDSFTCDIQGAAKANIASIWITSEQEHAKTPEASIANYILYSVNDIESTILHHAKTIQLAKE